MKTCVIYARYSSNNQTEQSIEGQIRVCREYAQRNNLAVAGTYIDPRHDGHQRQPRAIPENAQRQRQEGVGLCALL